MINSQVDEVVKYIQDKKELQNLLFGILIESLRMKMLIFLM